MALAAAIVIAVVVMLLVLFLPRYLHSWDLAGSTAKPADRAGDVNTIRSTLMQGWLGLPCWQAWFFTGGSCRSAARGR